MEVVGTVRITSIGLKGGSHACEFILGVFTEEKIGSIYAKAIRNEWHESIFCRKRRISVKNNEIKIHLKKGDTIQKYIDCISGIINKIKSTSRPPRHLLLRQRMRNAKLRRWLPSKVYYLAGSKYMKTAL